MTEWWVYVRDGGRRAFPLGPFTCKDEADSWVQPAQAWVEEHVDAMAGFYEWGVAASPGPPVAPGASTRRSV